MKLTRKTSESPPGAWLVEEPSKFHSLRSATEVGALSMVMVLQRMPPSPSIQMSDGQLVLTEWVKEELSRAADDDIGL